MFATAAVAIAILTPAHAHDVAREGLQIGMADVLDARAHVGRCRVTAPRRAVCRARVGNLRLTVKVHETRHDYIIRAHQRKS